ncbi:SDR family oxidoreductase [Curvibacter sp. CHRR-16]|uniref:SDR family NAD(P)-dependent oxidoreductase n=1 Tax=Curvibacter sp. CHRR-16 TaxID=2835872 RepID=UPI001BD981E1|nr:SDR family oxidoreductase [Curvibacter sp. CHRR-16]MBT0568832.1 SDR family oxidoreductase [Curvibacter sp. CHRR-16]
MTLPKRVLVLGATGAIGYEVVSALKTAGVDIVAHGRDGEKLESIREEFSVETVSCALNQEGELAQIIQHISETPFLLDGLVSCSGVVNYQEIGTVSLEALRAQFDINFVAPFMISQAISSRLKKEETPGSILHIASSLAIRSAPHTAGYAASKAALLSSVRSMAIELGASQIRVNALLPGLLDTKMTRVVRLHEGEIPPVGDELNERLNRQFEEGRKFHVLGRLGHPKEVADSAVHILGASWMTGAAVSLDGGVTL